MSDKKVNINAYLKLLKVKPFFQRPTYSPGKASETHRETTLVRGGNGLWKEITSTENTSTAEISAEVSNVT